MESNGLYFLIALMAIGTRITSARATINNPNIDAIQSPIFIINATTIRTIKPVITGFFSFCNSVIRTLRIQSLERAHPRNDVGRLLPSRLILAAFEAKRSLTTKNRDARRGLQYIQHLNRYHSHPLC